MVGSCGNLADRQRAPQQRFGPGPIPLRGVQTRKAAQHVGEGGIGGALRGFLQTDRSQVQLLGLVEATERLDGDRQIEIGVDAPLYALLKGLGQCESEAKPFRRGLVVAAVVGIDAGDRQVLPLRRLGACHGAAGGDSRGERQNRQQANHRQCKASTGSPQA